MRRSLYDFVNAPDVPDPASREQWQGALRLMRMTPHKTLSRAKVPAQGRAAYLQLECNHRWNAEDLCG